MKKGATINLDDEQAYAYVHDRYGVGDEENTSRMKRQQQYMTGFFKNFRRRLRLIQIMPMKFLKVCRMFPQQILL